MRASAVDHHGPAAGMVGGCGEPTRGGAVDLVSRPLVAVPGPGVGQVGATLLGAAEQHDLIAMGIMHERVTPAGSRIVGHGW